MKKNVVILSASPRRNGNSDILCDEFMKGATEAGHDVEKIFLADKNIKYCTGCGVCNTTHECVQKDDMKEILVKVLKADVIVMASPVYFYTINAQMKTLIDRIVPQYTSLSNKEFYFIITAADTDLNMMERSIECFRGLLDCLENPTEKGVIYGVGAWQKGEIKGTKAMQEAYEMGKNV